jgi:putative transposase
MPCRKVGFSNGEIYHIILRGLGDDLIFKDLNDYYRGIFSIYEFNNSNPVSIKYRREIRNRLKKAIRGPSSDNLIEKDNREKLVEVLCFCFMPNHVHLLVRQLKDDGIVKFMRKVGAGYAGYFNRKYERKGYVFQNRFRSIRIESDNQLRTIFNYIHVNPTSLVEPGWKEKGIKSSNKVIKFLEDYKWSSYQDYIGKENFPSVTNRDFISEFLGGDNGCKLAIEDWVKYKEELIKSQNILLE